MEHSRCNGVTKHSEDPENGAVGDTEAAGCCECLCLQKCSKGIVNGLETFFYK